MARKKSADSLTSSGLPADDAELLESLNGRVRLHLVGWGQAVVEQLADNVLAKKRRIIEIMQEINADGSGVMKRSLRASSFDYAGLLGEVKSRIRHAQSRAVLAANAELVRLYWEIGQLIDARQKEEGYGTGVIPRLARDLHSELPEQKGFSERNIGLMISSAPIRTPTKFCHSLLQNLRNSPSHPPSGFCNSLLQK